MTTRRREIARSVIGVEGDIKLYRTWPDAFCRYCGVELCTVQGKRPQDCEYWDDFWKEYGRRKQ